MNKRRRNLVICVDNEGYLASLELRKIYVKLADASAKKHGYLRIIDESGEDYLYPSSMFVPAVLPDEVRRAVLKIASDADIGSDAAVRNLESLRSRPRKETPLRVAGPRSPASGMKK
jgi:hypothetical protein